MFTPFIISSLFWTAVSLLLFPFMVFLVGLCIMLDKEDWADTIELWWERLP